MFYGKHKKIRITLFIVSLLVLVGSLVLSTCLLFSNYRNVQLLQRAESDFQRGDAASLKSAETQLLQLIRNDGDNEQAFVLLGKIAALNKIYPEMVYYTYQAHRLNPLSNENEQVYIQSLLFSRDFQKLEIFLSLKHALDAENTSYLLYAAGQNGNLVKYRQQFDETKENASHLNRLTHLLYAEPGSESVERDLLALKKDIPQADGFLVQEVSAALANVYLSKRDFDQAERFLLESYKLNESAFAPVLGRFYSNYRSMGKAAEIYEKYLSVYHDPIVALDYGELCCLLKNKAKLVALRNDYQLDSGEGAMLLCYYLDALGKFAENDIAGIKPYLAPLQKAISTPLACYIYFCVALESHSLADITTFYNDLLAHRDYLDLKSRADRAVTAWLKGQIGTSASEDVLFSSVAEKVYYRLPDATVGKYLLLLQRRKKTLDVSLLGDVMKRFPEDQGVSKIAIEYYLGSDLDFAEELIKNYETRFLQLRQDMLPYKIILAMRRSDFNGASALFQQNYSEELAGEYWTFASTANRVDDLRFLASKHPLYRPFCEAAILLSSGKKAEALKKLAVADAKGNLQLRFYAAKTLGEHGDYHAALEHYGKIPADSPYQLAVLMNSAELQWELNNKTEALNLARRAYELAPGSEEAQHCYADKLYKSGQFEEIANVVKVIAHSPYRSKMEQFLAASLEHKLKHCDVNHDKEKILRLCSQLKRLQPNNQTAAEYLRKVHEQQLKGHSGRE